MNEIFRDFISREPRKFHFKMGHHLASSLSGFVVGIIIASIMWYIGVWYFEQAQQTTMPNPTIQHLIILPPPGEKTK